MLPAMAQTMQTAQAKLVSNPHMARFATRRIETEPNVEPSCVIEMGDTTDEVDLPDEDTEEDGSSEKESEEDTKQGTEENPSNIPNPVCWFL
uniref:Uncharacterized protein n=1 Tax=Cannabis sativa TaxID=3483 RepID=A0A803PHT1_CANSA